MITWVTLALPAFHLLTRLLNFFEKKGYIDEGMRRAFQIEADKTAAIVKVTVDAQKEPEKWDESKLDDFLSKP